MPQSFWEEHKISESLSVREQVASILRKMLLSGQFETGERLVERTLSEQLNVSTTPVKEAFRILESEGLLYTVPRKGSFVSDFGRDHVRQISYARSAIEGVIAYFATEKLSEQQLDEMEKVLEESKQMASQLLIDQISQNNEKFHSIIRSACTNKYLLQTSRNLSSLDRTIRVLALSKSPEELSRASAEHYSVLEAIRARDPELVESRMREHIKRSANYALSD